MEILDVVNSALITLGQDTITSLTATDKKAARVCNAKYEAAIKRVFRELNWGCLKCGLDIPATESDFEMYASYYDLPGDCEKLLKVLYAEDGSKVTGWHRIGGRIYLEEGDDSIHIEYIAYDDDPDNWDSVLLEAVVLSIAKSVARTLVGDNGEREKEVGNDLAYLIEKAKDVNMPEDGDSPRFQGQLNLARGGF